MRPPIVAFGRVAAVGYRLSSALLRRRDRNVLRSNQPSTISIGEKKFVTIMLQHIRRIQSILLFTFACKLLLLLWYPETDGDDENGAADSPQERSTGTRSKSSQQQQQQQQALVDEPSFDIRTFRRLGNIPVDEFESKYAGSQTGLPTIFSNTTGDVFHAQDWTRQNLYQQCGSTPLLQPNRGPHCRDDPVSAKKNPNCHHVRIVHESLRGRTWGGTTVANLNELVLETVHDLLTIQDRSPLGNLSIY